MDTSDLKTKLNYRFRRLNDLGIPIILHYELGNDQPINAILTPRWIQVSLNGNLTDFAKLELTDKVAR